MVQLRRLLPLVLCFSLCLTVCVLPVSANDTTVVFYHGGDFGYIARSSNLTASVAQPFNNLSATMEYFNDGFVNRPALFLHGSPSYISNSDSTLRGVYPNNVYFEIIFPVGNGDLVINDSNVVTSYNYFIPPCIADYRSDGTLASFTNPLYFTVELLVDDEVVRSQSYTSRPSAWPNALNYSGTVNNRFSIRFSCQWPYGDYQTTMLGTTNYYGALVQLPYDIFTFEGVPLVTDQLEVVISKLDDISGSVDVIESNVIDIKEDVSRLNNVVTDMSNQLQDSNSSIWQAAGSTISGAIESLFVPSEQDIANVKAGFDDLAQDKLGGAYTAMETVEDTITQVNDKLNNPSAAEGVEFPGIAVPLGGEVGTVVLAESQMVTLPMELTAILHPLGGTIISIIAGLGTFNVLKDMVECFLSGFSYAEYLHRNKGGSDE